MEREKGETEKDKKLEQEKVNDQYKEEENKGKLKENGTNGGKRKEERKIFTDKRRIKSFPSGLEVSNHILTTCDLRLLEKNINFILYAKLCIPCYVAF